MTRQFTIRIFLIAAILIQSYSAFEIFRINRLQKQHTEDLIELSMIKYGIFNVDEWKEQVATIVAKKIDEFQITDTNREEMRVKIQDFLYEQIRRFRNEYRDSNSGSIGGVFRNMVASVTKTFDELEKQIPTITEEILNFMEDPENRRDLKNWVRGKLDEYADKTFAEMDYTLHDHILAKHNSETRVEATQKLKAEIGTLNDGKIKYFVIIGLLYTLVLVSLFAGSADQPFTLLMVVIFSSILLFLGVLLPMIEIDARIDELSFTLLGEPVLFSDQVLYFKSKSIVEVVGLLIGQGKIDLFLVAVLVFLFSVIFPFSKLLATVIYLFRKSVRSNRAVAFMVFKTGKWSMADVMVVAIFMAYIGFSGIVSEQLGQLENISHTIDILTTNHSKLNEGFFLFTGFVLLSLFISMRVEKRLKRKSETE
ncbi:paraquat-inducible protein A [Cryomorphaceae bacterium 1068]|nr:paraquat-inducible protein A [Cryomorphaceae bacterium 1068]